VPKGSIAGLLGVLGKGWVGKTSSAGGNEIEKRGGEKKARGVTRWVPEESKELKPRKRKEEPPVKLASDRGD